MLGCCFDLESDVPEGDFLAVNKQRHSTDHENSEFTVSHFCFEFSHIIDNCSTTFIVAVASSGE